MMFSQIFLLKLHIELLYWETEKASKKDEINYGFQYKAIFKKLSLILVPCKARAVFHMSGLNYQGKLESQSRSFVLRAVLKIGPLLVYWGNSCKQGLTIVNKRNCTLMF